MKERIEWNMSDARDMVKDLTYAKNGKIKR
jgi:hypothetical protein